MPAERDQTLLIVAVPNGDKRLVVGMRFSYLAPRAGTTHGRPLTQATIALLSRDPDVAVRPLVPRLAASGGRFRSRAVRLRRHRQSRRRRHHRPRARALTAFASSNEYGPLIYEQAPGFYFALAGAAGRDATVAALRDVVAHHAFGTITPAELRDEMAAAPARADTVRALWDRDIGPPGCGS